MKKLLVLSTLVAVILTNANARWGHHGGGYGANLQYSDAPKAASLTKKQKDDLIFMYQEEKLARDVYITLGNKWNLRVFHNIQRAEQRHMDAVKSLLQRYNLPIPVVSDKIGVFENKELQALYNKLVKKGSKSLKDALEVGKIIEETDIADLEEKIQNAPSDIQRVYSNLLRGSYNHLRAFTRNLGRVR